MINTFCSHCGNAHILQGNITKKCVFCNNTTYVNPLLVVVILSKIWIHKNIPSRYTNDYQAGVLLIKRVQEPKKDTWTLVSGFIDQNETYQEAAVRELYEETGLSAEIKDIKLLNVKTATNGNILIFVYHSTGFNEEELNFKPNSEVKDLTYTYLPIELGFETHSEALRQYFEL